MCKRLFNQVVLFFNHPLRALFEVRACGKTRSVALHTCFAIPAQAQNVGKIPLGPIKYCTWLFVFYSWMCLAHRLFVRRMKNFSILFYSITQRISKYPIFVMRHANQSCKCDLVNGIIFSNVSCHLLTQNHRFLKGTKFRFYALATRNEYRERSS